MPHIAADIAPSSPIDDRALAWLRDGVFANGVCDCDDAASLIALELHGEGHCAQWADFLIESVAPIFCDSAGKSEERLLDLVLRDGRVGSPVLFDLVLTVIANRDVPSPKLVDAALSEIGSSVASGAGVLVDFAWSPGSFSAWHADLVRSVLLAAEPKDAPAITREEMERLVALNSASNRSANAPEWNDLFVKAVANYVLSDRADLNQSRAVALSPAKDVEAERTRTSRSVLVSLDHMARAGVPMHDPARLLARRREKGAAEAIPEQGGLMGLCMDVLRESAGQAA